MNPANATSWTFSRKLLLSFGILISLAGFAQAPPPQQGAMGGNATGGPHPPVYDAQNRPITAGGFVDSGPVVFQDVTSAAGLGKWRHVMGTPAKKYILETDGSGVGLLDYDN